MLRKLILAWATWRIFRALLPILAAATVLLLLTHATVPLPRHRAPVSPDRRQRAIDKAHETTHHVHEMPR